MDQDVKLPNGVTLSVPTMRGDVPTYTPPDRRAWAEKHPEPYRLDGVPAKYAAQARRALEKDASTLSFQSAIAAQTRLDEIGMGVAGDRGLPFDLLIYFDSTDGSWWGYPE